MNAKLRHQDTGLSMYSETDASEMRKDELDVSLDNAVIDRLKNAFIPNKVEETNQFSHKRDKK